MVRIHTSDGLVGTGYSYTIGTGGSSVIALIRDQPGAAPYRPRPAADRGDLEEPVLRDARDRGRRDHVAGARRHRYRALGPALPRREAVRCGRKPGRRGRRPRAGLHHRRRLAAHRRQPRSSTIRWPRQSQRILRRQDESRASTRERGRSRGLTAVREAIGPGFEIMVDANQAFTVSEAIRRAQALEPIDLAWFEELAAGRGPRLPRSPLGIDLAADRGRRVDLSPQPLPRISRARRPAPSCRSTSRASAASTPWLKVAHLAETFNVAICPHFLDGASCLAVRRRAERRVGRVDSAARRHHRKPHDGPWPEKPCPRTSRASASRGIWKAIEKKQAFTRLS